jgi:uncharacterized protein
LQYEQAHTINQGGGEEGYEADAALVISLRIALGNEYAIDYPQLKPDESAPDFGWTYQIGKRISATKNDLILAGHSFGASMILKYLSENSVTKKGYRNFSYCHAV